MSDLILAERKISDINAQEYRSILENSVLSLNLQPEWLSNYVSDFGYAGKDFILEIRSKTERKLVSFLPLVTQAQIENRFLTYKRVIPCGYRPSDFFSIPVLKSFEEQAAQRYVKYFEDNSSLWDRIFLNYLPADTPISQALRIAFENSKLGVNAQEERSYLVLDATSPFENLLEKIGAKKRKYLRYHESRLSREIGEVDFSIKSGNLFDSFESFLTLYSNRRKGADQSDPFVRSKSLGVFKKNIVKAYGARGWIKRAVLSANKHVVAECFFFEHQCTVYYSMPSFDMEFEKFSPGRILLAKLIQYACENQEIKEFNFMRSEYDYKNWWKPENRKYLELTVENPRSPKLILANFIANVNDFFRIGAT